MEDLIPPDHLLPYGAASREGFKHGGTAFLHNILMPRLGIKADDSILDIGCSSGAHARILTNFLSDKGQYCGFDVLKDYIEWCADNYKRFPNFRFDFCDVRSDWYNSDSKIEAENYVFPYDDATFDIAFGVSLFTHLEPKQASNYFKQTMRVLKPGGRLQFTCYLKNESNDNKDRPVDIQGSQFTRASDIHYVLDAEFPSRGVAYDESAIRNMILDAGMLVTEITFGRWANKIDVLHADQDSIVAIKPL